MTEHDLVQTTLRFGLSCLQIGDNLPLHELSEERLHRLRNEVLRNNLRLEIGARSLTPRSIERYLELCNYFRAPLLRFVIDGEGYRPDSKTIVSIIKGIVPDLHAGNITLGIENHDRFKAKELADIMKAIDDSRVGICLDCVNSMGAGEGLEYVAEVLAPYTVNLHIKDFKIERLHHKMGFTITGAPAGTGMTDIPLIMEKISRYHRCQSAVLEQWVPFGKDIESTIATEKQWAERGVDYLKNLPFFKKKELGVTGLL